ncbi:MAG: efflux RND transporter permease subunit [Verrucomicrobiales bacterium]|nr:efflux RND transporter permease subunit [Verrucomicrobiales bacterium]
MIDRILEFSMRQRGVVLLLTCALFAGGLWSAFQLPIDAVPDLTGVQVQINTEVPVMAPEESEKAVTRAIELEMQGLPGVSDMRSLTKFGLSQVTLTFDEGTDIYRARQLVGERLTSVVDSLPEGVAPQLAPISTGLGEIFYYTLHWKSDASARPADEQQALMELYDAQEYVVKPLLRQVAGVAEINSNGGHQRQVLVEPDLAALSNAGMTVSDLADVIRGNVENAGGGIVSKNGKQLTIRAVGRVGSPEEIAELPVKFGAAITPLRVKDLARVAVGAKYRTGAATMDGQEVVLGTVMMLSGRNARVVCQDVLPRLEGVREKLPSGMELTTVYDRSELVDRTIDTVKRNLFEGAVLVVVVLMALLGNWRAALIVALAIPLSFLFAISGMVRYEISGNLMSLGAVDFGLIIDGAVVMVENIVRQLAHRQKHLGRVLTAEERSHTVLSASKQVANPMFFGVLIITLVYVPILALTGIEGKMFRPMALTVMLALGGALLLALSLMPVLCSYVLVGRVEEKENILMRLARSAYRTSLVHALRLRWLTVGGAMALFAGAILLYGRLGAEFVPKLDEGAITAMVYREVGMSLEESLARELKVERIILEQFPEVTRVFSRIGTSEVATDPMAPNENDLYVFYRPLREWSRQQGRPQNKRELCEMIEKAVNAQVPGHEFEFAQPIEMRFNEMLEGSKAELSMKIYGADYDVLERLAEQSKAIIGAVPGGEATLEVNGRNSTLVLNVRRGELARRNLASSEVNRAVSVALGGETVGTMIEGNRRRDIVVRLPDDQRSDIDKIRAVPVRVGEYGLVPLGKIVEVTTVKTVEPIGHENAQRRVALMVNVKGRDMEGFVHECVARIKEQVQFPGGYTFEFGGQFENLQKARARLLVVVPAALVLILVLIFAAFRSLRQTFLIATGIPLALTGGIVALWLRGMPFSITAAVGFIALSGVAVLNGLVMITYFNQLREEGLELLEAVMEGALTRLRPVIMTAAVAALGFVPMAIATGAGAEVQRPLATVVIGGILSSTFLTLVLLPVLYAWFERRPDSDADASEASRLRRSPPRERRPSFQAVTPSSSAGTRADSAAEGLVE